MRTIIARYHLGMSMTSKSDLATFAEGTRFLVRRPIAVLGLAALGMGLAALSPLLQIKAGLPDNLLVQAALTLVILLPQTLYLIPRFMMEADASAGDRPENPHAGWALAFEERWLRSAAAMALLLLATVIGLQLIIPGCLVFFVFGWTPLRVLLRGETLVQAARGSLQMTIRAWPRILKVALALLMVNLGVIVLGYALISPLGLEPTSWVRLTSPRMWLQNFLSMLFNLWLSATILALFRRVELDPAKTPPAAPPAN
jgi:hypothetical protein